MRSCLLLAGLSAFLPVNGGGDMDIDLRMVHQGDTLTIQPCMKVKTAEDLRYRLSVTRTGASGTSRTRQGGRFDTFSGDQTTCGGLSRVSYHKGDTVKVDLELFQGEHLIHAETRNYPETV